MLRPRLHLRLHLGLGLRLHPRRPRLHPALQRHGITATALRKAVDRAILHHRAATADILGGIAGTARQRDADGLLGRGARGPPGAPAVRVLRTGKGQRVDPGGGTPQFAQEIGEIALQRRNAGTDRAIHLNRQVTHLPDRDLVLRPRLHLRLHLGLGLRHRADRRPALKRLRIPAAPDRHAIDRARLDHRTPAGLAFGGAVALGDRKLQRLAQRAARDPVKGRAVGMLRTGNRQVVDPPIRAAQIAGLLCEKVLDPIAATANAPDGLDQDVAILPGLNLLLRQGSRSLERSQRSQRHITQTSQSDLLP